MRALLASACLAALGCAQATPSGTQQDAPPMMTDAPEQDAPPIDGPNCATSPCDIQTQCGCSATQACDLDFSDLMGTACRNEVDTGVEGTNCGGALGSPQKCAKKYICAGNGSDRSCERYCAGDGDCIAPRGQCVIQISANGTPIPGATTCSSNCDPAAATNPLCPTNWTCDLFTADAGGTTHNISDCRTIGAAGQGGACSATAPCGPGLTCVTQNNMMKCAKICMPPANTGCPGGTTCGSFATPFTIAGTEYGACL